MPRKALKGPSCDAGRVHREWKQEPAVRHAVVKNDRMFESHLVESGKEVPAVKSTIKDAVHDQFVLIPLLQRMAQHANHPVPYVNDLARESLAYILSIVGLNSCMHGQYMTLFFVKQKHQQTT